MNTMTAALISAGVPVPSNKERVWRAIKESPGITNGELQKRLAGLPAGTIGSSLADLEQRGAVYSRNTFNKNVGRDIKAYYTDMEVYTKQPMPKASKPSIKLVDKSRPVGNVPDETPPKKPQGFDIDNLTIAEARALYQRLHKMFGEAK